MLESGMFQAEKIGKDLKSGRNLTVSVYKNKTRIAADARISLRKIQGQSGMITC